MARVGKALRRPGDQHLYERFGTQLATPSYIQIWVHLTTPNGFKIGAAPVQCDMCWFVDPGMPDLDRRYKSTFKPCTLATKVPQVKIKKVYQNRNSGQFCPHPQQEKIKQLVKLQAKQGVKYQLKVFP